MSWNEDTFFLGGGVGGDKLFSPTRGLVLYVKMSVNRQMNGGDALEKSSAVEQHVR